jgi:hypothetical protein
MTSSAVEPRSVPRRAASWVLQVADPGIHDGLLLVVVEDVVVVVV